MVISVTRGGFAEAIPSNPPVRLELCGAVLPGGMLSVCSPAPSSQTIMMSVTMVGDSSFNAFACNGLLAKRLAGSLTIMVCHTGHRQPPPKFALRAISIRVRNIPVSWMHLLQLKGGRFTTTFAGVFYSEDDFTCIVQSTLFFKPCITIFSMHLWH